MDLYTDYKIKFNKAVEVDVYVKDDPCEVVDTKSYKKGQTVEVQFEDIDGGMVNLYWNNETDCDDIEMVSAEICEDDFVITHEKEWVKV